MTLEIITSDNLSGFKHGFFTRRGGASAGVFKGLNCGQGSSDQCDVVSINRGMVADALGVEHDHLCSVYQVHSPDVIHVEAPIVGEKPKADAMVTKTPGIALGVLSADCAPILFADANAGVIGAAHSGWKGAKRGVARATVEAMEMLGADRAKIHASVGPCISQRNYEVSIEFFEDFIADDMENSRYFAQSHVADKYQFDLPSFVLNSLRNAGIASANWTGHCTYAEPDRFYSYRRMTHLKEPDYGRLISAISIT
ncbi:laccase domain protein [Amylibacter ulvae]|uniref:Purine nucleoside phosphorylase n=1 Tax=Paramylibacter ulvae TaxID=1651968 RepID=A0ABQ3D7B8_9RHOB|nr:peptidoglycan editing factor PgeF [Amylibacter ulvae]GHA62538.1 laccase domain protein [Amylibacter ulvae]